MSTATQIQTSGYITGCIQQRSVCDIIFWLHHNRETAVVRVGEEPGAAWLHVRDGELVHAESNALSGEAALRQILAIQYGQFHLWFREPPATATIHADTAGVLLHGLLALNAMGPTSRAA